ncbi:MULTISPECIES: pyrroloquinoline quinone precursor peptide PqqA [unclassified Paraburkholderia]|uniref:pyrroloquinoline quinone precursor peptide PqqA n=1 Tax=unclassified Paraburkholderia TaxID=2615204 RepID=UPI00288A2D1A|nr:MULTISPECIES: pyrroloquinoline quinone precursor peptide PqqA [unclassified Paraburkholderia]
MAHFASFSPHRAALCVWQPARAPRRGAIRRVLYWPSNARTPGRPERAWARSLHDAGCRRHRASRRAGGATLFHPLFQPKEKARMQWTTPSYTDVRLGFEIVMYVATR